MKRTKRMTEVWSCGGGTQSIAIGALIIQGRLPMPDLAVIADTELEKQSTWDYFDGVLSPAFKKLGMRIYRVKRSEWATRWANGYFATSGQPIIPAFSNQSSEVSKLSAYCSSGWKQEVVNRWLSVRMRVKPAEVIKWLGFSFDEPRRWVKHAGSPLIRLPLVIDLPMRRKDCRDVVIKMGWPEPPRSNCWMCPNQSDDEWLETIRNRPEEWEKAKRVEAEILARDPHLFLHRQCVPLDQVQWGTPDLIERACDSGECFL